MKRKEWMSKDNPIRIEGKQVELKELESLVSYDKNDTKNIEAIKKFYSLLYRHIPSKNIMRLISSNFEKNSESYKETLGYETDRALSNISLSYVVYGTAIELSYILLNGKLSLGLPIWFVFTGAIAKLLAIYIPKYRKNKANNYMTNYSLNPLDGDFTEKIAKLMVLAIKKDGPSTMKDLGMLARLGTVYLNKKDYNVNPNEKELSIFKKLETKITNEKTVKQFLTDVRNDMQRVRDAKYEGYKNDMVELNVLAQDYMLDIDCKTNEEIIALQESQLWINLCKRLNSLEDKINSRINTQYTVYSQNDPRMDDLANQLSSDELEQTTEFKLNLKKSK